MSIHCLYKRPELVDAAIGIAGYFFPITPYDPKVKNPLHVIYGLQDDLRPWNHTKVTYYGRLGENQISFVEGMAHNFTKGTEEALSLLLHRFLGEKSKIW